jgi:hypothetical protein
MNGQIAPDKPYQFEVRSIFLLSREYGYKVNAETPDPNGKWLPYVDAYISDEKKSCIEIAHTEKKYVREELDYYAETQGDQKENWIDPGALLKAIMACKYENLGRSTIDGVEVEVFRTTDPNCRTPVSESRLSNPQVDVKLWVDVKTRLPARFEEFSSSVDERGNTHNQRQVANDFEWDVPVTAAEFEPPPVPDGYAVLDVPRLKSEKTAIQGLRQCVELLGNYLERISDDAGATGTIFLAFEKSKTPAALRLKEEIRGLAEKEKLDRVSDAGGSIHRLISFYVRLVQDKKDPVYYGKTVTPKDADKVLLRWKLSENKYRVIFGDLHAETVSPEKLAELENLVRQPAVRVTPTAKQETFPAVEAGNIIWVSDAFDESGDGKPDDQAWVDMLNGRGYTVDYTKGNSPSDGYWRTLNNDKVAALNAADLIIVSRCTLSTAYANDDEPSKWNSIKTPMILLNPFFTRKKCWSWLNTLSPTPASWPGRPPSHSDISTLLALDPCHPIFKDMGIEVKNQVKIFDQTAGSGKVSFNPIADVGNGALIAKPVHQDWTFIAEWKPGLEFYPGAGQTPSGRRMIFAAGTIEWPAGGCGRGEYNLNEQGEKLFINMIEYMLGNLVQEPNDY